MFKKYRLFGIVICSALCIGTSVVWSQESNEPTIQDGEILLAPSEPDVVDQQTAVTLPQTSCNTDCMELSEDESFCDVFCDMGCNEEAKPTIKETFKMLWKFLMSKDLSAHDKWDLVYNPSKAGVLEAKKAFTAHVVKHKKAYIITLVGVGCCITAVVIVKRAQKKK